MKKVLLPQTDKEKKQFEFDLTKKYVGFKDDTKHDLLLRLSGVAARAGGSGYQFVGYTRLEQFYRGDQWTGNEPPGASQRTDNYCSVIVDNISSLVFDDSPEISCPTDDPSDDILGLMAEIKQDLIMKVWEDNDFTVQFDEWAKTASLYGDGFLKGPFMEKDDEGKWKIRFVKVENPGSIRPIFADAAFTKLLAFIDDTRMSLTKAEMLYGDLAKSKGITLAKEIQKSVENRRDPDTQIPMVSVSEYWDDRMMGVFINDKLLDYKVHNWGFVPLEYIKNIYSPNHPYGKSDIEDVLDPQMSHNRTNNDLANLLRWFSSINLWGKNLEGMQALVAGLSRIYSLPDDGELHTFEKPGDPYITNTYVQQRRGAIVDISGISETALSSSQVANASGRALAMAFEGTIRKLNPRIKRFSQCLQNLNRNILKLYEIYFPESKMVINGDYRNKVFIANTVVRQTVDIINKLQSGMISLDTAQKEAGILQPHLEQKIMKKNLSDPILGGQIARQPSLLPRLAEGQNQGGEQPMPVPGNPASASQAGAMNMMNQQGSGAAAVPNALPQ